MSKFISKYIFIPLQIITQLQFNAQIQSLHQTKQRIYDVGIYFTLKTFHHIKLIPTLKMIDKIFIKTKFK